MKNQDQFAGRFSVEVDRILERQGRAEDDGPPPEYGEMLDVAERLAALDFSSGSSLRPQLRQQLLAQRDAQISARRAPWRRLDVPRTRRALTALVALAALVLVVGWTPAGRAVAQAVEQFLLEFNWPHTTVRQVAPGTPTPTVQAREGLEGSAAGKFSFEGRDFYYYFPEGEPVRDEVVSLPQAIAEAEFDFQMPAFLPDGFILSEVRLLGSAPFDVLLIYARSDQRLGLYQSFVGVTAKEPLDETNAILERRAVNVLTEGTVEEVNVGATTAALINGELLVWEENRISFHLMGPDLDAETLLQIAESLVPNREWPE